MTPFPTYPAAFGGGLITVTMTNQAPQNFELTWRQRRKRQADATAAETRDKAAKHRADAGDSLECDGAASAKAAKPEAKAEDDSGSAFNDEAGDYSEYDDDDDDDDDAARLPHDQEWKDVRQQLIGALTTCTNAFAGIYRNFILRPPIFRGREASGVQPVTGKCHDEASDRSVQPDQRQWSGFVRSTIWRKTKLWHLPPVLLIHGCFSWMHLPQLSQQGRSFSSLRKRRTWGHYFALSTGFQNTDFFLPNNKHLRRCVLSCAELEQHLRLKGLDAERK